MARPPPRLRRVRGDVRRATRSRRSSGSTSSRRCPPNRSPSCCARTTSISPRAATIRARTRCSKGSPAACRPRSCARGGHPSSSARAASGSTSPKSSPTSSHGCATSSTCAAPRIQRAGACRCRRPLPRRAVGVSPQLYVVGDRLGWSIDDDRTRLVATARRLGYDVGSNALLRFRARPVRVPAQPFQRAASALARLVAPARPELLPRTARNDGVSGVRPRLRRAATARRSHRPRAGDACRDGGARRRRRRRRRARCSGSRSASTSSTSRSGRSATARAFVVGSFVKDGVGMEEGLEPKLLKGPDTFVAVVERLRADDPGAVGSAHRAGARVRARGARAARDSVRASACSRRARSSAARTSASTSAS